MSDSLDDMSISELFTHLENLGINCSQLRKLRTRMPAEQLRKNLYRLLESHTKYRSYKNAFNNAE